MPDNSGLALDDLRNDLKAKFPKITKFFWEDFAECAIGDKRDRKSKELTDPVWHSIPLEPVEVDLMDMPLLQRLRRVRQLGLAYLVYSGAQHTRFDHSVGCVKAATRIFDQLEHAKQLKGGNAIPSEYRRIVRLAALLHDVGHTAFSHVGERALEKAFGDEFRQLLDFLDRKLPFEDSLDLPRSSVQGHGETEKLKLRRIPTAEIASVVIVLSEKLEKLLCGHGIVKETIPKIAAMIRGYPWLSCNESETVHDDFVRSIISGELDADKLDYVSRDSLFAGIPVAADVERLINQLTVLKVRRATDDHYVLGIKRGGVAAVEMFVMTRAYLHDRLYSHPKIRAAEQRLERLLDLLRDKMEEKEFLGLLYNDCGDDAVLDRLRGFGASQEAANRVFIQRNLPQRALAIVRRYLAGFDSQSSRPPITLTKVFEDADSRVPVNLDTINEMIAKMADAAIPDDVIVDWSKPNPIKEHPALWVARFDDNAHSTENPPPPISSHFNVEQLSNAYQDAKLTAWVFAAPQDREKVAAAAALYFAGQFGLIITSEALDHAKIKRSKFVEELKRLKGKFKDNPQIAKDADGLLKVLDDQLYLPPSIFEIAFRCTSWNQSDKKAACENLAAAVGGLGLKMNYYSDAETAIAVLDVVLRFREKSANQPDESWQNETEMQSSFREFVKCDTIAATEFKLVEHAQVQTGITDVILESVSSGTRVVVELKSQEKSFDAIQKQYAAQPLWYASTGDYGRISVLCARYRCKSPSTSDRDVAVWRGLDSSLAALVVGIPIPKATASHVGSAAVKVTP